MIQSNFHTHTIRCQHASGSDEDYVLEAIKLGMHDLGFADHTPWIYESGYVSKVRMKWEQLDEYANSLLQLKKKYENKINIHIGLEAEYFPHKLDQLISKAKKVGVQYLILGNHFYPDDEKGKVMYNYFGNGDAQGIQFYVENVENAFKTGYYAYLAHPELFLRSYPVVDEIVINAFEKICDLSKSYDIPLEYNLSGVFYNKKDQKVTYPHPIFWEIAGKKGCKAIIGFDAHLPQFFDLMKDEYHTAQHNLSKLGCELVYSIKHTLE